MRWSPHIKVITSMANNVLGLIKRNLWNFLKTVKETLYMTLVRSKLQYACSSWDPHYQKDKAVLERVQQKRLALSQKRTTAARFKVGHTRNDEKIRKAVCCDEMCYGFPDGKWEDYLIPNRERRKQGSHDFKFIVPKSTQWYFQIFFLSQDNNWMDQTPERNSYQSISLFLKVNSFRLSFTISRY